MFLRKYPMKRGPHHREKKALSATGLIGSLRKVFNEISTTIKSRKISLSDSLMSAFAMFSLKAPSLLAFDEDRPEPIIKKIQNYLLIGKEG
jgi:hypothetical protein